MHGRRRFRGAAGGARRAVSLAALVALVGCYETTRRPLAGGPAGRVDGGDEGTPVRLDAGVDAGPPPPGCEPAPEPRVLSGDAFVRGPDDLAALAAFERIEGDLRVVGDGVRALRLPRLERVTGAVVAVSGDVRAIDLPRLRHAGAVELGGAAAIEDVDLGCLEEVDGDLLLASLTIGPVGLERLRRVGRLLHFTRPVGDRLFPALVEAGVVDLGMPRFGRVAFPSLVRTGSFRATYASRAPSGTPPPELPVLEAVDETLTLRIAEARYPLLELPAFREGNLVVTARGRDTVEGVDVSRLTAPTTIRLPAAERLGAVTLDVCRVDAPRLRSAASLQLSGRPESPRLVTDLDDCEEQSAALPSLVSVDGELVLGSGLERLDAPELARAGSLTLVQTGFTRFARTLGGLADGVRVQANPLLEVFDLTAVDGAGWLRFELDPVLDTLRVRRRAPDDTHALAFLFVEECPRVRTFDLPDVASASSVTLVGMRDLDVLGLPGLADVGALELRLLESVTRFDFDALVEAGTLRLVEVLSDATVAFPSLSRVDLVSVERSRVRAIELPEVEGLRALELTGNPTVGDVVAPLLAEADRIVAVDNPRLPNCLCEGLVDRASPAVGVCRDNDADAICE